METQYAVHSTVRKAAFRSFRAQLPAHLRKNHRICDQSMRLVPDRRLVITDKVLLKHLPELREKEAQHILEVRTVDGRLVDLATMEPGLPAPAVIPPHPRLDSVAYDTPTGQYIPPYVGDDGAMPNVLPPGEKPQLLTQDERERVLDDAAAAEKLAAEAAATEATTDAELEAAIEAAQAEASEEAAPSTQEEVSSERAAPAAGKRKRHRR